MTLPGPADPIGDSVGREIHLDLVNRCIKALNSGTLEKIVVGRRFSVAAPMDLVDTFFDLIRYFPDAFGYLWYHPEVGTWLGATPERLIRYQDGCAETIALAGTKPIYPGQPDPGWTPKEQKEQQLVTQFILDQVQEKGLQPETGPVRNVKAGNLWHLGTDIRVKTNRESALELLKALHPTPAVCGVPRELASDFVKRHENFDREYYTGFLGEVGQESGDGFEFFVNLRCMQVRNGRAFIYVGGGITPDSDPESEWEETQAKSTTMLSILLNSQ
jgi:isochorismate synthase